MINRTNISVLIILIVGTALSFSIFFWQNKAQQKLTQEKFKTQIEKKAYDIKKKLELNMHALNSLGAYNYGSNTINRDEFQKYVSTIMGMHPFVYSLQWLPKVPHELKEKFEKDAKKEGGEYKDFFIYELDFKGKKNRVSQRQNYYPVFYAEPLEQNKMVIGLDVGFEKRRSEAILRSVETFSVSISAPINLIEKERGVLMFYPVYKDMQTKNDLSGFFIAVIKIQELIREAINDEFLNKGIASISVRDRQIPQNQGLLFSYECCDLISDLYYESNIDFASRSWSVKAYASKYFVHAQFTKYPLILLILLLGVTFLAAFGIYMMLKKQETLIEANEEMRRFENVATTREERIVELKTIIKELREQNGVKDATDG